MIRAHSNRSPRERTQPSAALLTVLLLPTVVGCAGVPLEEPWSLVRGAHPMPLSQGVTQSRVLMASTEEEPFGGSPVVDLEYGVTADLTLGLSVGEDLKRSAVSTLLEGFSVKGAGEEVGAVTALYGISGDAQSGGFATQLDIVLDEDGEVEFRPSFNALFGTAGSMRFAGRAGFAFMDGREGPLDQGFFLEAAAWSPIGGVNGMLELDATIWDDATELYLTPSITTQLREVVQFQAGVPIGLTNDSANYQFLIGFLFRF